jgi:hypothetical protein
MHMEVMVMASWSSDLFVFSDGEGQDYVSAALPVGVAIPASSVRRFRGDGPRMPIGWPKPEKVGDASAWMARLTQKGFTFLQLPA